MEFESKFLIHRPDVIINKLSVLRKNKCLLTVNFGDGDDSFITTILDINKENNTIVFYHGPQKDLIERLFHSDSISFKTEYLGIKIAFEGKGMTEICHDGASAFTMPVPTAILWIEAREYYRVKLPIPASSYCQLVMNGPEPITLALCDISISGFSIFNDSSEFSQLMRSGNSFSQCRLILGDLGEGAVSFVIRHKYTMKQQDLKKIEKIGCQFTEITPEFENIIQRYMLQIEREYIQNNLSELGFRNQEIPVSWR